MIKRTICLVWLSALASVLTHAGWSTTSTLHSPSSYSPAKIPLQWSSDDALEGATYTIYARQIAEENAGPWEKIAVYESTSDTKGFFEGRQGEEWEFRSAVFSPQKAEMVTLGDFDFIKRGEDHYIAPDASRVSLTCTMGGFTRTFYTRTNNAAQGNGCYHAEFKSNLDENAEIPKNAMLGVRFNEKIPTLDWSPYRYLEMYFRSNIPDGMDIWINTASVGFRAPILRYSQDGDTPNAWHSILIDLNAVLGEPQARSKINLVAFVKRIEGLDLSTQYEIQIDAIRLWSDRRSVKTIVDDTPPTPPESINSEMKLIEIEWSWTPSTDEESGIAGYAYQFTQDRRQEFPKKIMTETPSVRLPFMKPSTYQEYYFRVAACNKAGVWSPVVQKGLTIRP